VSGITQPHKFVKYVKYVKYIIYIKHNNMFGYIVMFSINFLLFKKSFNNIVSLFKINFDNIEELIVILLIIMKIIK